MFVLRVFFLQSGKAKKKSHKNVRLTSNDYNSTNIKNKAMNVSEYLVNKRSIYCKYYTKTDNNANFPALD